MTMPGEWDHYGQIGVIPAADIDRASKQSGCAIGP
jgi:hypothetical protein